MGVFKCPFQVHVKDSSSVQALAMDTVMYPQLLFLPKRKKKTKNKLLLGNECACMDKHVHAKSNVNTAIVYDTHTHTGTQVTPQTKPGA